jgi:DNA-nicking Smr family endonuclease
MKVREIDVHGLRVREALLRVERALRDMLLHGDKDLRVIVGKGKHSVNKIPVLKMAVLKAMRRYIYLFFRPSIPCN